MLSLASIALLTVAVSGLSDPGCSDFPGPCNVNTERKSYNGKPRKPLECPQYTVLADQSTAEYQVRQYPAAWWTAAAITTLEHLQAEFYQLFRYITGSNIDSVKIDMTAPVIKTQPTDSCPGKTMMFFAPYMYQKEGAKPPAPTEEGVSNVYMPEMTVAVRCYGGDKMWGPAAEAEKAAQWSQLEASLASDGRLETASGEHLSAGYDSPWKRAGRHNEVWVVLTKTEAAGDV